MVLSVTPVSDAVSVTLPHAAFAAEVVGVAVFPNPVVELDPDDPHPTATTTATAIDATPKPRIPSLTRSIGLDTAPHRRHHRLGARARPVRDHIPTLSSVAGVLARRIVDRDVVEEVRP
jgi:hypothetical protein